MTKKVLYILLASLFFVPSLAQNIPNVSFENWSNVSTFEPSPWMTAGTVTRSTDAKEGGYAIKLANNQGMNGQSFVASGQFGDNGIKGFPYDEQPLSMRFWASRTVPQ